MANEETIKTTVNDLSEKLGMERALVYGLIKYLAAKGLTKIVDRLPNSRGKGMPSNVYEIPKTVILTF